LRGIDRYWIFCPQGGGQIKIGGVMEKALRAWLDAHQLPAIAAAVLGVIATLSVLLVLAGYLIAKP
jgi:hypothetical protein